MMSHSVASECNTVGNVFRLFLDFFLSSALPFLLALPLPPFGAVAHCDKTDFCMKVKIAEMYDY